MLALSSQLGISQDLIWTGGYETDSEEPSLYLRASDLAVLPFDQGVFLSNSSFASCAAHRLPIITTKGLVLEPQFVDKDNLVLVPPKEPQQLAEAILATLADVRLLEKISHGAYQFAENFASWSYTAEQTISIFRGEKPAGRHKKNFTHVGDSLWRQARVVLRHIYHPCQICGEKSDAPEKPCLAVRQNNLLWEICRSDIKYVIPLSIFSPAKF